LPPSPSRRLRHEVDRAAASLVGFTAALLASSLVLAAEPAPEPGAPPMLMPVLPALAQVQARLYSRPDRARPGTARAKVMLSGLASWMTSAQGIEAFAYLLILFIVSVGLEWLYFTYAFSALKAADIAEAESPGGLLWLGLRRLLLKGVGLVLFAVASISVSTSLDWPPGAQDVVLTTIIVVVALRVAGSCCICCWRPARPGRGCCRSRRARPLGRPGARCCW